MAGDDEAAVAERAAITELGVALENGYAKTTVEQFVGGGEADYAGADDDNVLQSPSRRGSSAAKRRVDSAVTQARPIRVGTIPPSG